MNLLIPSFLAGILTVLAPCVLAVLPIILASSSQSQNRFRPAIVIFSLGISIIIFTLLLKASTWLIDIPTAFWRFLSGGLVLLFGLTMIFPDAWSKTACTLKLSASERLLAKTGQKKGLIGSMLLGAALGPVFNACSPTYSLILAIVLPANFFLGLVNLLLYTVGLMLSLLVVAYGGKRLIARLRFAANPYGFFKRSLGTIVFLTGVFVITGFDKKIEAAIVQSGYSGALQFEQSLLDSKKGQVDRLRKN